jgi:hypothetical protein
MLYNIGNTNTIVIYFHYMAITAVILFYNGKLQGGKSFLTVAPGTNIIKPFTAVIYKWAKKHSLMFANKARSLPKSGAPEKFFTLLSSGCDL